MDFRSPRHPANRRLIRTTVLCTAAGVLLCLAVVLGRLPFLPVWIIACTLFLVAGQTRWRYRTRVRPLTLFETVRAFLLVMLLTLAVGYGLVHALPWIFENLGSGPWLPAPAE